MAYIAKRSLRWTPEKRLKPGDPVPIEPGRNYAMLLRVGHIEEVGGDAPAPSPPPAPTPTPPPPPSDESEGGAVADELLAITTPKLAKALSEAGFRTIRSVASASVDELKAVSGIGAAKAEDLIDKALESDS